MLKSKLPASFWLIALAANSAMSATFDRIVAVVGDEIILQSELREMEAAFKQQPQFENIGTQDLQETILKKLIDEKIMLAVAERDTTITLTDAELDNRVRDQMDRAMQENGGESRFALLLEEQAGMSLPEYKATLRDRMRSQILVQKLQQKHMGNLEPSREQVKRFFQDYKDSLPTLKNSFKISHIEVSVKTNPEIELAAAKKCDSLIKLLNEGAEFEELAKQFSDDPSGEHGGDLGYTKRGTLDPHYENAAFRMNAGEYTQRPVRSKFGYHIIKVTGKRDIEVRTSHILILVTPTAEDTARTKAWLDSLRTVALEKNNFGELAKKFSEDKATKDNGGSLGWFTMTSLQPQFRDIVDTLKAGEISDPALIEGKLHLLKVVDRREERQMSLEEDWTQISQLAKNYWMGKKLSEHVDRWRKQVHVENRYQPPMAGPAAPQ